VTSYPDEINQLIADIDDLLSHNPKGISKLFSNQGQQEKEILQRVRNFLLQLEEDQVSKDEVFPEITNSSVTPAFSSLLTQFKQQDDLPSGLESSPDSPELNDVETVPINQQLSVIIQPLKAEISRLLAEREDLNQEIRQLEQKRLQNNSLSQQLAKQEDIISDFLEVLMGRLVPYLKSNSAAINNPNLQNLEAINSAIKPILESAERIEQLANLARNLDQRLLSLDGTVNIVFDALERNINTYYQSLSEALAKMHSQGMQGEQLMTDFLNNLTQYLQQQVLINDPSGSNLNREVVSASPLLAQPNLVEELISSEAIYIETLPTEIRPINLETELLQEQSQSAKDLQLTNTDQVDELYASFFNNEVSSTLNFSFSDGFFLGENESSSIAKEGVDNDLSVLENNPPPVASISDSSTLAETNENDGSDDTQEVPNSVDDVQENQFQFLLEETPVEQVQETLNPADVGQEDEVLSLLEERSREQFPEQPNPADIITVLTDLLLDTSNEQLPIEVSNQPDNSETELKNQDLPLDDFVAASTGENLVSLLDDDASGIPEIVLDAKQLQQLDQDLANFDQPLNYSSESITKLDSENQGDSVTILPSQEVDLSLTNQTSIEDQKEDVSESSITNLQSPITSPQDSIPHEENNDILPGSSINESWYLGIDIGTTGISAALLNRSQLVVYPIYWSAENQASISTF
jgi:hypothetical protein